MADDANAARQEIGQETRQATRQETRDNVQAHLLRPSKFQIGDKQVTRDWSLFFFFRILPQAEFDAMMERMAAATEGDEAAKHELWQDFAHTALVNAGLVKQQSEGSAPDAEPDRPADAFLKWLKAIVSADKSGIKNTAELMLNVGRSEFPPSQTANPATPPSPTPNVAWHDPIRWMQDKFSFGHLDTGFLQTLIGFFAKPDDFAAQLELLSEKVGITDPDDRLGPLPVVALYEIVRQCAPAMMNPATSPSTAAAGEASAGILRGEAASDPKKTTPVKDSTPINIAFTHPGLAALKMDPATLASFPEVFKQGMAARAERLHDTGPSAPDFWDGELGLRSIHGYFTGGFAFSGGNAAKESYWKAMRSDVRAFNEPVSEHGRILRFGFRILFRLFGLEIMHIELGQDPYEVDKDGAVNKLAYRYEHFGFRDGLSQPFVDLGLGDTLPGGGTPSRNRTWSPVAPGEIFLNEPDEDGVVQLVPISRQLTVGGTFLVFRKLEQDVAAFRAFLARHRPKDPVAQSALAAQFVGRWPNGVPLVLSAKDDQAVDPTMEAALNNFRYAADDPLGEKCPLGAHIRRTNPRDIGGRGEARRHRILRRGISYGGPMLKDAVNDGEKRGLLFIAANSRIDLQFEVIQANWINGGELLGQAGLGRCPLTGSHDGASADSFLEAGAAAPLTGLPRFVTTRGGDYFFAPGIDALREIANGNRFKPKPEEIPAAGFSMGDAKTPALFDVDRLRGYGQTILKDDSKTLIRIALPGTGKVSPGNVCFVGRHEDVRAVFRNKNADTGKLDFSVRHYSLTGRNITRGADLVIGTEELGPTQQTRARLHKILFLAWERLGQAHDAARKADVVLPEIVRAITSSACEDALRRTSSSRRIDFIGDLSAQACLGVVTKLYGVPAPTWLSELAVALPFARQHIGELPPEWLATVADKKPDNPGLATLQLWSAVTLADIVGNLPSIATLHLLSRQAGSEMIDYIDTVLSIARATPPGSPSAAQPTLLAAFVQNAGRDDVRQLYEGITPPNGGSWMDLYFREVNTLLFEIISTTMASVPLAFASIMQSLLQFNLDLPTLMQMPGVDPSRIIYEADRLNPFLPVRMRYCEADTKLPSGATIAQGEWVAALIQAANLDDKAFKQPFRFSLDPKMRPLENYLLFNEEKSPRECWGRNRVAMVVMEECLKAASRLQGLRKIAGNAGEPTKLGGIITVSSPARFAKVAPLRAAP